MIWGALLKNFIVEDLALNGFQKLNPETVREIPGFLAFTTVLLLAYFSEQRLAVLSTLVLGVGIAFTGYASNLGQLLTATFVMSLGFHYFQTIYKSLSLQWFDEHKTPLVLGRAVAVSNAVTVLSMGLFLLLFLGDWVAFPSAYLTAGLLALFGGLIAWVRFPKFPQIKTQAQTLIFRKRYWLYYVLTFLSGARRQIFIVFATFILVEIFGLSVTQMLICC